jgi:lysophospholipase L1-like esterase
LFWRGVRSPVAGYRAAVRLATRNTSRALLLVVLAALIAGATSWVQVRRVEGATSPTRIMPLGDSLTDGYNVPGGYRISLEDRLVAAGRSFDFVGSRQNGPSSLADKHHEGWIGYTIDQIRAQVPTWFAASPADVVLLMAGTNDVKFSSADVGAAAQRMRLLLTEMTDRAPSAKVIVSTIPPQQGSGASNAVAYNDLLPDIVGDLAGAGRAVTLVDSYAVLSSSDLADTLHLTEAGYAKVAGVWAAALTELPPPPPPPSSGGVVGLDGFGRADASVLGSAEVGGVWVGSGGARFGVVGGQAAVVSGLGEGVALLDVGVADVSVEARLRLSAGVASPGLSVRAVDASNQLLVGFVRRSGVDRLSLYKVSGGVYQELFSRHGLGLVGGATYVLRVDVVGSAVRVFVNGGLSFEHVLSSADAATFGSRTRAGLRTHRSSTSDDGGSRWDDVTIRSLTSTTSMSTTAAAAPGTTTPATTAATIAAAPTTSTTGAPTTSATAPVATATTSTSSPTGTTSTSSTSSTPTP